MTRWLMAVSLVFALAVGVFSCVGQSDDSDPFVTEQAYVVPPDVGAITYGRLWVRPNPVVFGTLNGEPMQEAMLWFANVGSEKVTMRSVKLSGDRRFSIPEDLNEPDPETIYSAPHCSGGGGMAFPIWLDPPDADTGEAVIDVRIEDPTTPSLKIPVMVDRSIVVDEAVLDFPVTNIIPTINPNPVRLEASMTAQVQELCMDIRNPDVQAEVLRITAVGKGLSVERIENQQGQEITLPNPPDDPARVPTRVVLKYKPVSANPMDGALLVEFLDENGEPQKFAVPVLAR